MKTSKTKTTKDSVRDTHVVMVLDRTGSMQSRKAETIQSFNQYVDELQAEKGRMRFTLVQFDTRGIDTVYDAVPIEKVKRLTDKTYVPRDSTNLHDAIGQTINRVKDEEAKVLFVVLTDGQENASREYDLEGVRRLIKQQESEGWTFVYLGIGLESWDGLQRISVGTQSVGNYYASAGATGQTANAMKKMARASVMYASSTMKVVDKDFFKGQAKDD